MASQRLLNSATVSSPLAKDGVVGVEVVVVAIVAVRDAGVREPVEISRGTRDAIFCVTSKSE